MPIIEATAFKADSDEEAFNSTAFMFQYTIVYLRHWQPRVVVMPIMSLAATTVTTGCHNDNLWCQYWQQNGHMPNLSFSVRRAIPSCDIDIAILCSSASGRLIVWTIFDNIFYFNPTMDKQSHAKQSVGLKLRIHSQTSTIASLKFMNFIPQFIIEVIIYPCCDYS